MKTNSYNLIPRIILSILLLAAFSVPADDIQVTISYPVNGQHLELCASVEITPVITVNSGSIQQVKFYRNGSLLSLDRREPYSSKMSNLGVGYYEIIVGVTGSDDVEIISEPVYIIVGDWTQGNRIINGQFDCALGPWRLGNYEGGVGAATLEPEADIASGSAVLVDIINPGTIYWHIQLMQDFPIKAGHIYEVYFIAEVPDDKEIYVSFQMDHDPFTNYLEQPVLLIGNNAYGPITFESAVDDPTVEFKFMVAGNDIPVYIDDVKIIDLNMEPVTSVEKITSLMPDSQLLTGNYPNPFNGQTRIFYTLPGTAEVKIQLMTIGGEIVREWRQGLQNKGDYFLNWDGLNHAGESLPSAVYLYRIQANAADKSYQATRRIQLVQ